MKNNCFNSLIRIVLLITVLLSSIQLIGQQQEGQQHEELGQVNWLRDYDTALEQSEITGKPVLILFQEIPGCATCRNYGNNVLSNPLLVDAIQMEYVPLAIFNNKGGADAKILEKYGEPAWNNPVIRIVDNRGKDLITRLSGNYTEAGLALQLVLGLQLAGRTVPKYLDLAKDELAYTKESKTAYFQMYCFWSGEAHLGNHDKVINTSPGFMNGHEVVKVQYIAEHLKIEDLTEYAAEANCKLVENPSKFRIDKDPQYYLKHSEYSKLELTAIQKSKINAALLNKEDPVQLLSPSQIISLRE